MFRHLIPLLLLTWFTSWSPRLAAQDVAELRVIPDRVTLESPEATEQILIVARIANGDVVDVTRTATRETASSSIVALSASGRLSPLNDGEARLSFNYQGKTAELIVTVSNLASPQPVSFRRDIVPVLTKSGCNSGACHGKAEGQNGFKLSVFGYDAVADHDAIVHEGRGRRVFAADPDQSLFLRKAAAVTPHGGGQKLTADSRWYRLVRRWITEGMRLDEETDDPVVGITVEPSLVTLPAHGTQQLRVTARLRDGSMHCITAETEFQSNQDGIATVDRDGLISATDVPGEAAVLVRYSGHVAVCRVTRPRDSGTIQRPPERNFIDGLVWNKLELLRIQPSAPADDATYLRRVFLDTIGTLPTAEEARAFLQDQSPDKRERLAASLLQRPEYNDYWTQRWSDLLQVDKDTVTPEGTVAMTRWIHRQLEHNVPFDQFARGVLTARGSTLSESPAAFFQVQDTPEKLARATSQLFLGVRLECAQCHHHPFERWDQKDYFAFAAFFTGVDRKPDPRGGSKIVGHAGTPLKHPRTGQDVEPAVLGEGPASLKPGSDWRVNVADWVTSRQNPWFARTIANRVWAHYFGRGLVEPVDDLRATNPASNEQLLDALAAHLVEKNFDLRAFTLTVLHSQAYQLSSQTNDANVLDEQNYSRASWKPIPAEVLLDAVSQVTGVPESFNGWPEGYRAIQVWDNKLPSQFLEVFGRPMRQSVCACERGTEPSIAQALHLMNSAGTMDKIQSERGTVARLAKSDLSPEQLIDEVYLSALSRFPSAAERTLMLQTFAESGNRRECLEDVVWTLLNTREFVFNH
ncbi:MAG: DUF1553 domain-containing protein [Planctomycetaceae bacterium]|nr:DUF1553 domain-containing protein [Planctomycetaceae bacterium]